MEETREPTIYDGVLKAYRILEEFFKDAELVQLTEFNDTSYRKHSEILEYFDSAIKWEREKLANSTSQE